MAALSTSLMVAALDHEEQVVVELDALGVSYLSRRAPAPDCQPVSPRAPARLLADIVRQPSARVRSALIALLLARPDFWPDVSVASTELPPPDRTILMLYYSAAVVLQQHHEAELRDHLGPAWQTLPDLFSTALALEADCPPERRLLDLAACHVRMSGSNLNWAGSYQAAATHLLRQWQIEAR